jgi:hypothetical protein
MIGTHITSQLKQRIISGKYIELSNLLPPKVGPKEKNLTMNNMGEIVAKDNFTPKVETIEQWTDLMHTYAMVYLSAHPSKTVEMLKYIQTVRMGVNRGAMSWKEYDIQYRLRKEQNPASSWGKVDSELWLMYMTPGSSVSTSLTAPSTINHPAKCYNYNYKGSCDKYPCKYLHICLCCGGLHPLLHCTFVPRIPQSQNFEASNPSTLSNAHHNFRVQNPNIRAQSGYPQNSQRPVFRPEQETFEM